MNNMYTWFHLVCCLHLFYSLTRLLTHYMVFVMEDPWFHWKTKFICLGQPSCMAKGIFTKGCGILSGNLETLFFYLEILFSPYLEKVNILVKQHKKVINTFCNEKQINKSSIKITISFFLIEITPLSPYFNNRWILQTGPKTCL